MCDWLDLVGREARQVSSSGGARPAPGAHVHGAHLADVRGPSVICYQFGGRWEHPVFRGRLSPVLPHVGPSPGFAQQAPGLAEGAATVFFTRDPR